MNDLPRKRLRTAWGYSMPVVGAVVSWYVGAVAMENGVPFGWAMLLGTLAAAVILAVSLVAYRAYLRRLVGQVRRAKLEVVR